MDAYVALKAFKSREGFGGLAPTYCKQCYAKQNATLGTVTLTWQDPLDTEMGAYLLSSWKKTVIVKKQGGYPESPDDGTTIVVNEIRNQYRVQGYTDNVVGDVSNWYYMAFPYSDNGAYSINKANRFSSRQIFAYRIAKNNSDPASRVEYLEDAAGLTPAHMDFARGTFDYGDWEGAFFMPRPCMLKADGTVDYYLNPEDYTKKVDGTASDIANEAYNGNAMMEFPTVWSYHTSDGTYDYCYISDSQVTSDYNCFAHHDRNGAVMPYTYVRIYEGSLISNKIRSLSGKTLMNSQTGTNEITYAQNNGALWYTGLLCDRLMINDLLILIGKSTNVQAVFGNGHITGAGGAGDLLRTGTMDDKGLFWGSTGNEGVKVFGIENYWANQWERIGGLMAVNKDIRIKLTFGQEDGSTTNDYNTTANGYINPQITMAGTAGGYINKSEMKRWGYLPKEASGSDSTYECDGLWFNGSNGTYYGFVGGVCRNGLACGAFCVYLNLAVGYSYWDVGASVSCKPTV